MTYRPVPSQRAASPGRSRTGPDRTAYGGRDLRKRDIARIADLAEKGEGDLFYGLREGVA